MAKRGRLPWDAVLSAELFHHYKPDLEVYLGAADLLGCKPAEVVMVAAHRGDLKASRKGVLRTAFVARPLEFGPNGKPDIASGESFDLMTSDFVELASLL